MVGLFTDRIPFYRCPESIDDLRILHGKKQRKIAKKQQIYNGFHEKLNVSNFKWQIL